MTKLIPIMFRQSKLPLCLAAITKHARLRGPEPFARVVQGIENEMVAILAGLRTDILRQRPSPALPDGFEQLMASSAQVPGGLGPRWAAQVSDVLDAAAQQASPYQREMIESCGNHLPLWQWPERVCEHALQL